MEKLYTPTEEHGLLRDTIRNFVAQEVEPQAAKYDREEVFNVELFRKLGDLGLLGITVPEEYGGSGLDAIAAVIAHEELSYSDPGFALAYLAHSMLCVNNIAVNAEPDLCREVLPKLCTGEAIGAMGLSEPAVGTDVLGMQTNAKAVDGGYLINGRKLWITNGTIDEGKTACDVLLLYANTGKAEDGKTEISTFIVKRDAQGFTVGQKIMDKLGMRASNTAELCFDDCIIPRKYLLGEEGDSVIHMMRNLEIERVTLAAMGLGIARRALEIMVGYSNERKAFGRNLREFGQIQAHIGNSYADYRAARSYVYSTAAAMDLNKEGQRVDSDGVKLVAARVAKEIADAAIQTLGGFGYVGEYVVERLWRDAKLLEIGGGTMEAHQKNITKDLCRRPELIKYL